MGENKIKHLRKKKKWSQQDLADKIKELTQDKKKISRAYISLIENGEANPTVDVLNLIAQALGTELKNVV